MKRTQLVRMSAQILFFVLFLVGTINSFPPIMGIVIFAGVVIGPIFCGFACPFGFLQDIMGILANRLGIRRKEIPNNFDNILKYLRYLIFIVVGAYSFTVVYQVLGYDPRANFLNILYNREVAILSVGIVILFTILNMFYPRVFCRYFCYEGAKYSMFGTLKAIRISRDDKKCISCELCDKKCPMGIKISNSDTVVSLQCINCYQCTDICPVDKCLESKFSFGNCLKLFREKKNLLIAFLGVIVLAIGIVISPTDTEENIVSSDEQITMAKLAEIGQGQDLADGSYIGEAEGFKGIITTEVVVKDEKIISIKVLSHNDDAKWYNRSTEVIDTMIVNQSTDIDVVSGATFSSAGIINSVKNALSLEGMIEVKEDRKRRH